MSGPTSWPSPWILWHWPQSFVKTTLPATASPGAFPDGTSSHLGDDLLARRGCAPRGPCPSTSGPARQFRDRLLARSLRTWLRFSAAAGTLLAAIACEQLLAPRRAAASAAQSPARLNLRFQSARSWPARCRRPVGSSMLPSTWTTWPRKACGACPRGRSTRPPQRRGSRHPAWQ